MARRYQKMQQVSSRRTGRVSQALWPIALRQSLAIHHTTLKHRRLERLGKWWGWFLGLFEPEHTPLPRMLRTPMPARSTLIRVLETVDLSQTGVEHFLNAPQEEERHTTEISLEWMREQTT